MRRVARMALAPLVLAGVLVPMLGATPAHAYGRAAQYQIAISQNCNNPTLCAGQLGGFWGWAEFDNNNTGDTEFAFCGHAGAGGGGAGAGHESIDITGWYIAAGLTGYPDFWVTSEIDTFTGHGPPQTEVIASENVDIGVPAVPGHYNLPTLVYGFGGPGVTNIMQVVLIPGR